MTCKGKDCPTCLREVLVVIRANAPIVSMNVTIHAPLLKAIQLSLQLFNLICFLPFPFAYVKIDPTWVPVLLAQRHRVRWRAAVIQPPTFLARPKLLLPPDAPHTDRML